MDGHAAECARRHGDGLRGETINMITGHTHQIGQRRPPARPVREEITQHPITLGKSGYALSYRAHHTCTVRHRDSTVIRRYQTGNDRIIMEVQRGGLDLDLYLAEARGARCDVVEIELVDAAGGGEFHCLHCAFSNSVVI